jgi:hypothetical protein
LAQRLKLNQHHLPVQNFHMMTPKNDKTRLQEQMAAAKPIILPMLDNNQKNRHF